MSISLTLALLGVLLDAPPAPDAPGSEQGLAELRRGLGLAAPVGKVVVDANGTWLEHAESGARIGPYATGKPRKEATKGAATSTLWFEGEPGAALVLSASEAWVARMNDAGSGVVWTSLVAPDPKVKRLLATTTRLPLRGEAKSKEARLALGGVPGGAVLVRLTKGALEVVAPGATPGDEALLTAGSECGTGLEPCGGSCDSSVATGAAADGGTILRFEQKVLRKACDTDDWYMGDRHSHEVAWVAFAPDGSARLLQANFETNEGYDGTGASERHYSRIEVPGGLLTGDAYTQTYLSGAGYIESLWTWRFVPRQGDPTVLVSFGESEVDPWSPIGGAALGGPGSPSAADEPTTPSEPRPSTGPAVPEACPTNVCPPHYRALIPLLEAFCADRFDDRMLAETKRLAVAGELGADDLAVLFNVYGAMYGYEFKKVAAWNTLYYGRGTDGARAWLPQACRTALARPRPETSLPRGLTAMRDAVKALWRERQ